MAGYAERKYFDTTHDEDSGSTRRNVEYFIYDAASLDEARSILGRDSDYTEGNLVRSGVSGLRQIAATTYEGTVNYAPFVGGLPDPESIGGESGREASFQFDTGGGTMTRRVSISSSKGVTNVASPVDLFTGQPTDGPDCNGLINAGPDGVAGVEVTKPVFNFSITKAFERNGLPASYIQALYTATGCINSLPITMNIDGIVMSFQRGDLLFQGASGNRDENGRWQITYSFAFSKGESGNIVPGLAPINKPGWSVIEIRTTTVEATSGNLIVPVGKPLVAFVHQVYQEYDFNTLGI